MKKILFLSKSYPNQRRSATLLCTHRVMECIAASGRYETHALCLQYEGEATEEIIKGIHVHRCKPSLWTKWRQRVEESRKHHGIERFFEVAQKALTMPLYPNTEPITIRKYNVAAKRLQLKEKFDVIISEHHGLLTLLTGCRLMQSFNVKHVAMLWDPVKGQMATVKLPKSYTDSRIAKVETFVARNTTLQISTKSMRQYHDVEGDISADHRIYLDIPSILKPEVEVPTEYLNLFHNDGINIVFSGLLSGSQRDPRPIIRLLNKTAYAGKINLLFFSMGANDVLAEAQKSFKGNIVVHDYIPLSELHTLYLHADYFLNVSHVNPNMVPSKIFEYMSYGKPIISTFPSDGDAAQKYVSRYPEGLCIDVRSEEKDNVSALEAFLACDHNLVPFDIVKEIFKDNTPERFLEVIDKVINQIN